MDGWWAGAWVRGFWWRASKTHQAGHQDTVEPSRPRLGRPTGGALATGPRSGQRPSSDQAASVQRYLAAAVLILQDTGCYAPGTSGLGLTASPLSSTEYSRCTLPSASRLAAGWGGTSRQPSTVFSAVHMAETERELAETMVLGSFFEAIDMRTADDGATPDIPWERCWCRHILTAPYTRSLRSNQGWMMDGWEMQPSSKPEAVS